MLHSTLKDACTYNITFTQNFSIIRLIQNLYHVEWINLVPLASIITLSMIGYVTKTYPFKFIVFTFRRTVVVNRQMMYRVYAYICDLHTQLVTFLVILIINDI